MKPYRRLIIGVICMLSLIFSGCLKQENPPMAKLEDLANKRIGVGGGTVYDQFVVNKFPAATALRYKEQSDLILALKGEKVDAAITNLAAAKIMLKPNPEIGILTDEVLNFPIGIGFSKNNPELREKFNAFLRTAKADGSLDAMYKKWFDSDIDKIIMPKFPIRANARTVVAGVAIGDLPSVGYADGEYIGFDIELLQKFAQKEGINLEFVSLEFGALIASLASGKVDIIADCIAITDERKKQVAFSDAYMEDKSAAIALKKNIAHLRHEAGAGTQSGSLLDGISESFYSNIVHENRFRLILDGLRTTIVIALFSLLFGTILGAFVCYLRMSKRKIFSGIACFYISLMRGIPVLVLLMITYYVIFAKSDISPVLVAIFAFGLNFAAYVAEMFRSSIESIDRGQTEAGIAGGFTPLQTFVYIVMPQAIRRVMPVYKGETISLVKMTSVVGYVAVQDLTKASDIIRSRTFDAFFPLLMTAALYFAISWALLQLLECVEKSTDPRRRGSGASLFSRFTTGFFLMMLILGGLGVHDLYKPDAPKPKPALTSETANAAAAATDFHALFDGKRVAVITGTTGDFVIRKNYPQAKILDMVYAADAALALKANKADAFVFDRNTLHYLAVRSNNELVVSPGKLASVDIVIPMRIDDKELHRKVNAAITQFESDGTINGLYKKWILEPKDPAVPEIPTSGKNGVLRMGTCLLTEPYAYVSQGKMAGFDIELAHRIAALLEVRLEISDMTFDAMITALRTGKIDMAIANFYKIEEGERFCEFSIPYIQNDISVLVRRRNP